MKMRLVIVFCSVFTLFAVNVFAHRENTYYLYGQFGDTKVGLRIDEYGNQCMASYFTFGDRYDHILEGNILEDGQFVLSAITWDENKNEKVYSDSLSVKEVERDIWEGIWKPENGSVQPVHLLRIDVDALNHPFINAIKKYRISPYEAYRTKDIQFADKHKEKIGRGIFVMRVVDSESEVEWFRLVPDKKFLPEVDTINTWLTARHIKAINEKYSCVNMGERGDYNIDYTIRFLDRHVISYTETLQSSCYGGQSEDRVTDNTLRIQSAKTLMLEDLIWFGDQPQPKLSEGGYKWFQYRYKYFGPKVLEIMKNLYPEKVSPRDSTDCQYGDVKLWQFPTWYLTPKGIYLGSKSATANKKCDNGPWSVISYAMLKDYFTDDFKYLGMIK